MVGHPNWQRGIVKGQFSTKTDAFVTYEVPALDGALRFEDAGISWAMAERPFDPDDVARWSLEVSGPSTSPMLIHAPPPADSVQEHRIAQFLSMGFCQVWAYVLGVSDSWEVNVESVRKMLSARCPHRLVIRIVL
ncbi:MAG: hypothetical protein ACJ740_05220 [Gaiellales bacterium]